MIFPTTQEFRDGDLVAWRHVYGSSECFAVGGLDAVEIAPGSRDARPAIALRSDGTVVYVGSLSVPGWTEDGEWEAITPPDVSCEVVVDLPLATQIATGEAPGSSYMDGLHILALTPGGEVAAFGNNTFGQCDVPEDLRAVAIAAGGGTSMAARADGSIVIWGSVQDGAEECLDQIFDRTAGTPVTSIACRWSVFAASFSGGEAVVWPCWEYDGDLEGDDRYDDPDHWIPSVQWFADVAKLKIGVQGELAIIYRSGTVEILGIHVVDTPAPGTAMIEGYDIVDIDIGAYVATLVARDGHVFSWEFGWPPL